jgi:hypothetical protein
VSLYESIIASFRGPVNKKGRENFLRAIFLHYQVDPFCFIHGELREESYNIKKLDTRNSLADVSE